MLKPLLTLLWLCALFVPHTFGQDEKIVRRSDNVLPEGTVIQLSLRDPVSSKLSEPGDPITAVVKRDVVVDGRTLLREGTEIIGRVTLADGARRPFKGGRLHLTFEQVRMEGREQKLTAIIQSASDFTRDTKVKSDGEGTLQGGVSGGDVVRNVGTAAGIGMIGVTIAILSSVRDRDLYGGGLGGFGSISQIGAITGAAILGGSVVTGLLLTKGKEVRLDGNTVLRLKLERAIAVE